MTCSSCKVRDAMRDAPLCKPCKDFEEIPWTKPEVHTRAWLMVNEAPINMMVILPKDEP